MPLLAVIPAGVSARTINLAIPAGPLGTALTHYAEQTDRQILFAPGLVAGRQGAAVFGHIDADAALRRLLMGSGLAARQLGSGVIIVELTSSPMQPAESPREEQIIVTALKRETLLVDTAVSMNVVTGEEIGARSLFDLRRMGRGLPGFSIIDTGSGQQRLAIRGVYGTGEATVGVYYDETPVSGPSGTTFDPGQTAPDVELIDVKQVELLRGPQGTLYGASSMGGTLRILFNQPDLAGWHGEMAAGLDLVMHGEAAGSVSGVVNAPLVKDRLGMRAVLYRRSTGGYIDRPALGLSNTGGGRREGGRLALAWAPGPDVHLSVTGLLHRGHIDDAIYWSAALGSYRNDQPTRTPTENKLDLVSATGRWDAGFATVTATASIYRWLVVRNNDYTSVLDRQRTNAGSCRAYFGRPPDAPVCSPEDFALFGTYTDSRLPALLYQPMRVRSRSGELRLTSHNGGPTSWTLGGFLERRHDRVDSYAVRADPATGIMVAPLDITGLRTIWTTLSQQALFGEATHQIAPRISATAGMRYFHYSRSAMGDVTVPNVLTGTADLAAGLFHTRERGSNLKFQLAYRPAHSTLLYIQAAEGFRPGGVNITPNLSLTERSYHADRLWSYEIGSRFTLAEGALSANLAAFHIDWSDMIFAAASANGAFTYNTNIGPVDINGGEAQLTAVIFPGAEVVARISYVDARLAADQTTASPRGLGRRGDRLPNVPHLSAALSVIGKVPLAAELVGSFRADLAVNGGSGTQFNPDITYYVRSNPYALVDVQAGLARADWSAALAIQNFLGAKRAGRLLSNSFAINQVYSAPPRTFSLTLARKF